MNICPLCECRKTIFYAQDKYQHYYHCPDCDLIFVPGCYHLSANAEKRNYDTHENSPNHEGYRNFLNLLQQPLMSFLSAGAKGLDFGSGPGPTLHLMLAEAGFEMETYDPYYANNTEKLNRQYDFVTATEVVEHFNNPAKSWRKMLSLIKQSGYLAIMTLQHDTTESFTNWWYKNDRTHIVFYSELTWQTICKMFNLQLVYHVDRVVIFQRN